MKIKTFKKLCGTNGTKKSRAQASVAVRRGKVPGNVIRNPGYNPNKVRLTRAEKIKTAILQKVDQITH